MFHNNSLHSLTRAVLGGGVGILLMMTFACTQATEDVGPDVGSIDITGAPESGTGDVAVVGDGSPDTTVPTGDGGSEEPAAPELIEEVRPSGTGDGTGDEGGEVAGTEELTPEEMEARRRAEVEAAVGRRFGVELIGEVASVRYTIPTNYRFAFVSKRAATYGGTTIEDKENIYFSDLDSIHRGVVTDQLTSNADERMTYGDLDFNGEGTLAFRNTFSGRPVSAASRIYWGWYDPDAVSPTFTYNAIKDLENRHYYGYAPSWTSDGQLSFVKLDVVEDRLDYLGSIYSMDSSRTVRAIITDFQAMNEFIVGRTDPVPGVAGDDGRRYFFARRPSGDESVIMVLAQAEVFPRGRTLRELRKALGYDLTDLALSPDGSRLAYISQRRGRLTDGSPYKHVIEICDLSYPEVSCSATHNSPESGFEGDVGGLDWTYDGKYLMFHSNHDGDYEIYIIKADFTQPAVQLTDNDVDDKYPTCYPTPAPES